MQTKAFVIHTEPRVPGTLRGPAGGFIAYQRYGFVVRSMFSVSCGSVAVEGIMIMMLMIMMEMIVMSVGAMIVIKAMSSDESVADEDM